MKHLKLATAAFALGLAVSSSPAAFHVMQIEQVIGGINGDTAAQAIQLRLRGGGQTVVSNARLRAWDAAGANPVLLIDITTNVSNGTTGDNILLASASFNTIMTAAYGASYVKDFTLTNLIPASYLNGGKVTFEDDGGTIYWSTAFGAYTGTNLGSTQNDADGNFGAPTVALPTASRQGVIFPGAATAFSTTNLADYALTANPASVRNNARTSYVVAPEPTSAALLAAGALGLGGLAFSRRRRG